MPDAHEFFVVKEAVNFFTVEILQLVSVYMLPSSDAYNFKNFLTVVLFESFRKGSLRSTDANIVVDLVFSVFLS